MQNHLSKSSKTSIKPLTKIQNPQTTAPVDDLGATGSHGGISAVGVSRLATRRTVERQTDGLLQAAWAANQAEDNKALPSTWEKMLGGKGVGFSTCFFYVLVTVYGMTMYMYVGFFPFVFRIFCLWISLGQSMSKL